MLSCSYAGLRNKYNLVRFIKVNSSDLVGIFNSTDGNLQLVTYLKKLRFSVCLTYELLS